MLNTPLSLKATARLTGLAYGAMIPTAVVGFFMAKTEIFVPDSATETVANLLANSGLARLGYAALVGVVLAQALASLGFYALFRKATPIAAFGIATFGLMNAAAIMAGSGATWAAFRLSDNSPASAETIQALYHFDATMWHLGGLFFGLWLIPMGWSAIQSGFFHAGKILGLILILGGIGYVASAFLTPVPGAVESGVIDMLAMPATIGEFWMMFALMIVGVRKSDAARAPHLPQNEPLSSET